MTGPVAQNMLDDEQDGAGWRCVCLFFMVWLVFYGLHALCVRVCVCMRKKEGGTSVCVEVSLFCFFDQALSASCSSQISMLLKGIVSYLEQKDNIYLHYNICSTSFDAGPYCGDKQGSNHH